MGPASHAWSGYVCDISNQLGNRHASQWFVGTKTPRPGTACPPQKSPDLRNKPDQFMQAAQNLIPASHDDGLQGLPNLSHAREAVSLPQLVGSGSQGNRVARKLGRKKLFARRFRPLPSAHPKQSLHLSPHTSSWLALSIIRPSSPHRRP